VREKARFAQSKNAEKQQNPSAWGISCRRSLAQPRLWRTPSVGPPFGLKRRGSRPPVDCETGEIAEFDQFGDFGILTCRACQRVVQSQKSLRSHGRCDFGFHKLVVPVRPAVSGTHVCDGRFRPGFAAWPPRPPEEMPRLFQCSALSTSTSRMYALMHQRRGLERLVRFSWASWQPLTCAVLDTSGSNCSAAVESPASILPRIRRDVAHGPSREGEPPVGDCYHEPMVDNSIGFPTEIVMG